MHNGLVILLLLIAVALSSAFIGVAIGLWIGGTVKKENDDINTP